MRQVVYQSLSVSYVNCTVLSMSLFMINIEAAPPIANGSDDSGLGIIGPAIGVVIVLILIIAIIIVIIILL